MDTKAARYTEGSCPDTRPARLREHAHCSQRDIGGVDRGADILQLEQVRYRLPAGGKEIRTLGPPQDRQRSEDGPFRLSALPRFAKGTGSSNPFPPAASRQRN
jgi:hypothetical protein